MEFAAAYERVFNDVMSGAPLSEVLPKLRELPAGEQQALLCSVCAIHPEIARTCVDVAERVCDVLTSECTFFVNGLPTCVE